MATVSTTLPSDGQTIDAADVNTPINAILSEFNGNIDNDNIKSGAAINGSKIADATITNAKLSTTAGELGGAWTTWTPTYTNLTVGNGTVTAKYKQVGKTVHYFYFITLGSTSSVGTSPNISLPVTLNSDWNGRIELGRVWFSDANGTDYAGYHTTVGTIFAYGASSTYVTEVALSASVPFTWATGDTISIVGTYEAA